MSKTMEFSYDGKEYKLEFTKRTVKQMADEGFVLNEISDKPMLLMDLFRGAFLANHRSTKRDVIEEIYQHMPNKDKLIEKLAEMYNDPLEGLMEEPSQDDAKKVSWVTNW